MSPEQVARVRSTWALAAASPRDLAATFYARLFAAAPEVRPLFAHVDPAAQAEKLTQTLAVVVKGLDGLPCLIPAVEALGRRHATFGVTDAHWAPVGDALLWALADVVGPAFDAAARDAWAAAYGALADAMRAPADVGRA
ncbi:globin domain-containing protein, partial [Roseisolibacter sp. H3M3-2]|uniref:globin domain-containing protein n=1 Tax=Roseisolibacter sp. H3M3-2 TaxID=3031323 RepID=UPI0023DC2BDB